MIPLQFWFIFRLHKCMSNNLCNFRSQARLFNVSPFSLTVSCLCEGFQNLSLVWRITAVVNLKSLNSGNRMRLFFFSLHLWLHWSSSDLFLLWSILSVNVNILLIVIPVVVIIRKEHFHRARWSSLNWCVYGQSMSHPCFTVKVQQENQSEISESCYTAGNNTDAIKSLEEFSQLQNFNPTLWHNSTKLHPKWLLMIQTFNG